MHIHRMSTDDEGRPYCRRCGRYRYTHAWPRWRHWWKAHLRQWSALPF